MVQLLRIMDILMYILHLAILRGSANHTTTKSPPMFYASCTHLRSTTNVGPILLVYTIVPV